MVGYYLAELNCFAEMGDISEATMPFEEEKCFDHVPRCSREIVEDDWRTSGISTWEEEPHIVLGFDMSMLWRFHGGQEQCTFGVMGDPCGENSIWIVREGSIVRVVVK